MKEMNIEILGIAEKRYPGSGKCKRNDVTFYYAGNYNPDH